VFVAPGGERSFVQDRGAALRLAPEHLREEWFASAELVHIPTYSLLDHPLGDAGKRAADLAHSAGALVTVDLSSTEPLLALGRRAAVEVVRGAQPDLLFAAGSEAGALGSGDEELLDLAPIVVLKRGPKGALLLYREGPAVHTFEVATKAVAASDTTGAGDAFDAGFILGWLAARRDGVSTAAGLRRGVLAGHRLAIRHLRRPREELAFG
jgi:sugar/nucleoside kinase (ribokinase family)